MGPGQGTRGPELLEEVCCASHGMRIRPDNAVQQVRRVCLPCPLHQTIRTSLPSLPSWTGQRGFRIKGGWLVETRATDCITTKIPRGVPENGPMLCSFRGSGKPILIILNPLSGNIRGHINGPQVKSSKTTSEQETLYAEPKPRACACALCNCRTEGGRGHHPSSIISGSMPPSWP